MIRDLTPRLQAVIADLPEAIKALDWYQSAAGTSWEIRAELPGGVARIVVAGTLYAGEIRRKPICMAAQIDYARSLWAEKVEKKRAELTAMEAELLKLEQLLKVVEHDRR